MCGSPGSTLKMPLTGCASRPNCWITPGCPYDLAQSRYANLLSSIVEVNQAQLNLLAAQITYANTQFEYLLQRSALSFQTGTLR